MDREEAGLEELARVIAFFLVRARGIRLAGSAVFDGRSSEDELAVGVDVDLRDAFFDGVDDLIVGDASAAMEDERDAAGGVLNVDEGIDVETSPISRIKAMDISDASASISSLLISSMMSPSKTLPMDSTIT